MRLPRKTFQTTRRAHRLRLVVLFCPFAGLLGQNPGNLAAEELEPELGKRPLLDGQLRGELFYIGTVRRKRRGHGNGLAVQTHKQPVLPERGSEKHR